MASEVILEQELRGLFGPTTDEADRWLERSVCESGTPLMPLVIWDSANVLVDGYRRYRIISKHQLKWRAIRLEFMSLEHAKSWKIADQLMRRDMPDHDYEIAARFIRKQRGELPGSKFPDGLLKAWQHHIKHKKCWDHLRWDFVEKIASLSHEEQQRLLAECDEVKSILPVKKHFGTGEYRKHAEKKERDLQTRHPKKKRAIRGKKTSPHVGELRKLERGAAQVSRELDKYFKRRGGDGSDWESRTKAALRQLSQVLQEMDEEG